MAATASASGGNGPPAARPLPPGLVACDALLQPLESSGWQRPCHSSHPATGLRPKLRRRPRSRPANTCVISALTQRALSTQVWLSGARTHRECSRQFFFGKTNHYLQHKVDIPQCIRTDSEALHPTMRQTRHSNVQKTEPPSKPWEADPHQNWPINYWSISLHPLKLSPQCEPVYHRNFQSPKTQRPTLQTASTDHDTSHRDH